MLIKLYGVRGSIASPGANTLHYGGNTSCVFVELNEGTSKAALLVFDAGTGIRLLGDDLLKRADFSTTNKPDIHILFSHYHWDHIQGFPFFKPAYQSQQQIYLIAAHLNEDNARSVLDQMVDPHFPVPGDQLHANIDVLAMDKKGALNIADSVVSTMPLNHPGGGTAYRIDSNCNGHNCSMAYVTDNELEPPTTPRTTLKQWQDFLYEVDYLIHDAMYLDEEKDAHLGWGHSILSQTLALARDAKVKHLILFHHEPERSDKELDLLAKQSQEWMSQQGSNCQVIMAKEGDQFVL